MVLSKGPLGPLSRAEKIQKVTPVLQDSRCIAAIDFGTSSLSVAYATPTTRGDLQVLPLHCTLERIPNSILIKMDHVNQQYSTIQIGLQAQSKYNSTRKDASCIYFEE